LAEHFLAPDAPMPGWVMQLYGDLAAALASHSG